MTPNKAKPFILKNHFAENQLFLHRVTICLSVVILLTIIIIIRVFYLQIIEHEKYSSLSRNNQVRLIPLSPARGVIYDRNGILLAENVPGFSLNIIPENVKDLKSTLDKLKTVLSITDEDIKAFYLRKKQNRKFNSIPLKLQLSEEEVAKFAVHQHLFPGIEISATLVRHYPQALPFAHILGFVGRINESELNRIDPKQYQATHFIGKIGIEKNYEELLRGFSGFQQVESDAKGRTLRVLSQTLPTAGKNITLTIDYRLQMFVYDLMKEMQGAAVVMDPKTGEILSLVSAPSFDPNLFVHGIPVSLYKELNTTSSKPLFNRVIKGQYPPASTVKPLYAIAGLEHEVISPKTKIHDPGWFQIPGQERYFRDWKEHGHGFPDLYHAILESCDTYFYELALKLGIDNQSHWMKQFGFGEATGIDLVGESEGTNPSKHWKRKAKRQAWFPGETVNNGIGQGYALATPIQLVNMAATIANHGTRVHPHLLLEPSKTSNSTLKPVTLKNEENWEIVINAMQGVIEHPRGTAHRIHNGLQYTMAGKTGTAQLFSIKQDEKYEKEKVATHLRDHGLFIAFAPIDNPELAVVVILENQKGSDLIARQIMDYYFITLQNRHFEIERTEVNEENEDVLS